MPHLCHVLCGRCGKLRTSSERIARDWPHCRWLMLPRRQLVAIPGLGQFIRPRIQCHLSLYIRLPGAPGSLAFGDPGYHKPQCAKRVRLDGQSCRLFPHFVHNDLQKSSLQSSRYALFAPSFSRKRPKRPVTPYPGRFCRELLCFDDFAAQPCL